MGIDESMLWRSRFSGRRPPAPHARTGHDWPSNVVKEDRVAKFGAWQISTDDRPRRLRQDREFLERHLETWITNDPSLLGSDLRWVSRQLTLPDRSRLDLLGLSMDGTWVIVELKHGSVGSGTIAQALHYLLEISKMSDRDLVGQIHSQGGPIGKVDEDLDRLVASSEGDLSQRDYRLVVAGVGDGEAAREAAQSLANLNLAVEVQVVTFELVTDAEGRRTLIREVEDELPPTAIVGGTKWTLDTLLADAETLGVRDGFEAVIDLFESRGWRKYQKKNGLNFNPRSRKQAFWVRPAAEVKLHIGYLEFNFPDLFDIDETAATELLGPNWLDVDPAEALTTVERWLDRIETVGGDPG